VSVYEPKKWPQQFARSARAAVRLQNSKVAVECALYAARGAVHSTASRPFKRWIRSDDPGRRVRARGARNVVIAKAGEQKSCRKFDEPRRRRVIRRKAGNVSRRGRGTRGRMVNHGNMQRYKGRVRNNAVAEKNYAQCVNQPRPVASTRSGVRALNEKSEARASECVA